MGSSRRGNEQIHHPGARLAAGRCDGRGHLALVPRDSSVDRQCLEFSFELSEQAKTSCPDCVGTCHQDTEMQFGQGCAAHGQFARNDVRHRAKQHTRVKDRLHSANGSCGAWSTRSRSVPHSSSAGPAKIELISAHDRL